MNLVTLKGWTSFFAFLTFDGAGTGVMVFFENGAVFDPANYPFVNRLGLSQRFLWHQDNEVLVQSGGNKWHCRVATRRTAGSKGPRGGPLTARLSRRGGRAQASVVVWCCVVGLFPTLTVPACMQAYVSFHFSSCRHAKHGLFAFLVHAHISFASLGLYTEFQFQAPLSSKN